MVAEKTKGHRAAMRRQPSRNRKAFGALIVADVYVIQFAVVIYASRLLVCPLITIPETCHRGEIGVIGQNAV